jgi:hypothetical protein
VRVKVTTKDKDHPAKLLFMLNTEIETLCQASAIQMKYSKEMVDEFSFKEKWKLWIIQEEDAECPRLPVRG